MTPALTEPATAQRFDSDGFSSVTIVNCQDPSDVLRNFIDLARAGRHRGRGGERRALAIAVTLCENLPGLDSIAREGLKLFVDFVAAMPETARRELTR